MCLLRMVWTAKMQVKDKNFDQRVSRWMVRIMQAMQILVQRSRGLTLKTVRMSRAGKVFGCENHWGFAVFRQSQFEKFEKYFLTFVTKRASAVTKWSNWCKSTKSHCSLVILCVGSRLHEFPTTHVNNFNPSRTKNYYLNQFYPVHTGGAYTVCSLYNT